MPELQGAEAITVGAWSKQRGEHVDEGETLMEVHTDKVNAEIPSPLAGTVAELLLTPRAEAGEVLIDCSNGYACEPRALRLSD